MESIRILIYTDNEYFNENPNSIDGGLTDLENFVKHKTKDIADVCFTLLNRHDRDPNTKQEINGAHKLTRDLLQDFDELWVFGLRQINKPKEPYNELERTEVDALEEWMLHGGVFLTGDHSSPDPTNSKSSCAEKGHHSFLGLGRALGYRIPRAGQLRIWKGPPTACTDDELSTLDNFNTQEGTEPCLLDDPLLQIDSIPQTLILRLKDCEPHRLFSVADEEGNVKSLSKFPDHWHEGRVVVPSQLDSEWPTQSGPPEIIATGTDKRFPKEIRYGDIVVAYDGFEAEDNKSKESAGRIVADSSFHHYDNYNLRSLSSRDCAGLPVCGSDLDQIAEYYGNLALWLAPTHLRDKIKLSLLLRIAKHPQVWEVLGNSVKTIGRTAHSVLLATLGKAKLDGLFRSSKFEKPRFVDELFSLIFLAVFPSLELVFQKPDIFLGAAVEACHDVFELRRNDFFDLGDPDSVKLFQKEIANAIGRQMKALGDSFTTLDT